MRLRPHRYNGFLFQRENKVSAEFSNLFDWNVSGISTSEIARSSNFPLRGTKNYSGVLKVLDVNLLDVSATRDDFVMAMDVFGDEQGILEALDEFGRTWYVEADFIGQTEDSVDPQADKATFGAIFAVSDPVWKLLTPSSASLTTDGSGDPAYVNLNTIGNVPALPIIKITPLSNGINSFGFTHQRFVTLINNSPNAFVDYPVDITGGGIDTAALIAGGKMLANGDDCRVYISGVDSRRWFGHDGIDSADTAIFVNLNLPANSNMTLGVVIAGAGDLSVIQIENTAANRSAFLNIPLSGNVLIGNEIFVYSGRAFSYESIAGLYLTGITRAQKQTSEEFHDFGDTVYFIPEIWLYYGNPDIAPYVEDDTTKPIIDLATSTNEQHDYDEFYSLDGKRTAIWKKGTYLPSLLSRHYTATENTLEDPATVIGTWVQESSVIYWLLNNPCGFSEIVDITGKKYSANGIWTASFGQSLKGNLFDIIFFESAPTAGAGWVALDSHSSVTLTPGPNSASAFYLLLFVNGNSGGSGVNANGLEFDTFSIILYPAYTPTISLAAEASNFDVNSVITNSTTGDSLTVSLSLEFAKYVIIDTKEKTVTLFDGSNQINAILDFPIRAEWLQLLPQTTNEMEITEAGEVTFEFTWEDRSL